LSNPCPIMLIPKSLSARNGLPDIWPIRKFGSSKWMSTQPLTSQGTFPAQ